jgi:predicted nucleotidyltransferase
MSSQAAALRHMLLMVASALGEELRSKMAFVGGATTGLLVTDEFTREQVRATDDVDLIVHAISYVEFVDLQCRLTERGFKYPSANLDDDIPICAMYLKELRVDFMPKDENVLGFSNRWYEDALASATDYELNDAITIRLVAPVYFLATKIEAFKGRGKGDYLVSRDIEDIIILLDGRPELLREVEAAPVDVRDYLAEELGIFLSEERFEDAINSHVRGDSERVSIIFDRLYLLAGMVQPNS